MTDKDRVEQLECVLAQFLQPIRDIPFPVVIKALCGSSVERLDMTIDSDRELVENLIKIARVVGRTAVAKPIRRPRPNEVGNDLEPFVLAAAKQVGIRAELPTSKQGRGQRSGYPDLLVWDGVGRPSYLEVKSFEQDSDPTTFRSFYMSPSKHPKVCMDARHLVLGFGVTASPIQGSRDANYVPSSFKLIDLYDLECDLKYEFNSDNKRMYSKRLILAEGPL
jgi:hypothetical protein